jgi:hypothetical protein
MERDGGALRGYVGADPTDEAGDSAREVIDVCPRGGTLVLFRSRVLLHEVLPARRRRWALSVWIEEDCSFEGNDGDVPRSVLLHEAASTTSTLSALLPSATQLQWPFSVWQHVYGCAKQTYTYLALCDQQASKRVGQRQQRRRTRRNRLRMRTRKVSQGTQASSLLQSSGTGACSSVRHHTAWSGPRHLEESEQLREPSARFHRRSTSERSPSACIAISIQFMLLRFR